MVEWLPSRHKALGSSPRMKKKKKKEIFRVLKEKAPTNLTKVILTKLPFKNGEIKTFSGK
jgi:hypothetical protein